MADEADKPRIPDDNSDEISPEATPSLADFLRESQALQDRLIRFIHYQQIGISQVFDEIEQDPKREVPEEYMNSVGDALGPYSMEYRQFMRLMSLYQTTRKGVLATIISLKELLKEQQCLLASFNAYLPAGYHIFVPQHEGPDNEAVIEFFNEVQEKLQDDDESYLTLQNNLNEYRNGNKDIISLKQEIDILFRDKPNLTSICFNFIDALASNLDQPQMSGDFHKLDIPCEDRKDDTRRYVPLQYINSVKDVLGPKSDKYRDFDSLMSSYKTERKGILATIISLKELLKEHQNLLSCFNAYLPVGYHIPISQPGKSEGRDSTEFYTKVQEKLQDDDNSYLTLQYILGGYLRGCKDFPTLKQEIDILFRDRPDVNQICCHFFDTFLSPTRSDKETDQSQMSVGSNNDKSDMTCQKIKEDSERDIPFQYINSVKRELGPNSQECRDFLELMSNYKAERIGIPELLSRLKVLLKEHYKLVIDLHNYLPKEYQTDLAGAADFVDKVKRAFIHDKEHFVSFQNILQRKR